jgi:capsule polysaccharide export protein KpsE/RkpR
LHLGNKTDMADIQELTSIDQATPEELTEIIAELEKYRERLVNDTLSMAQRAKVMKAQALAHLEPNLAQIDAQLQALRQRQAALTTGN